MARETLCVEAMLELKSKGCVEIKNRADILDGEDSVCTPSQLGKESFSGVSDWEQVWLHGKGAGPRGAPRGWRENGARSSTILLRNLVFIPRAIGSL